MDILNHKTNLDTTNNKSNLHFSIMQQLGACYCSTTTFFTSILRILDQILKNFFESTSANNKTNLKNNESHVSQKGK